MNIEELVAGLKEQGLGDDEIKIELEKVKQAIDAYLGGGEQPETPAGGTPAQEPESDDAGIKRVFGV